MVESPYLEVFKTRLDDTEPTPKAGTSVSLQYGHQSHLRRRIHLPTCGHLAQFVKHIHDVYAGLVDRTQGLQETCTLLEKHPEDTRDILKYIHAAFCYPAIAEGLELDDL